MRRRDRQAFRDARAALAASDEKAEEYKAALAMEARNVGDLSIKLMRVERERDYLKRETDRLLAAGRVLAEQLDVDGIRELAKAVDRFVPTEAMKANLGALAD